MTQTSKIHEEMVIKAKQLYSDWVNQDRTHGYQGYPSPVGYQMYTGQTKRQYVCKEDYSYIAEFNVHSIFKDEIYEGKLIGNDSDAYLISKDNKHVAVFKKNLFYSLAEMRDKKIDEIFDDGSQV